MSDKNHHDDQEPIADDFDESQAEEKAPPEETEKTDVEESVDAEAEPLEEKLSAAIHEAKETYDRFLRVSAEFDNYKKRTAREMESFKKYANESLIKDLLPVIDNLERALQSSDKEPGDSACIAEGVGMTLKEILKVLEKYNVTQVESLEKPFNPAFHEAVMRVENNDHPENTVIEEYQKGYLLHDRLIRPAMVVVSTPTQSQE